MSDKKWIIAICPWCGQTVDIAKLLLDVQLGRDFIKSRLTEWVSGGLTIEIRNESHFPVSVNPCGTCIRDTQTDQIDASILSLLDEAGAINTDLLDDTVHDIASRIASGVNNSSSSAQVRFITKNEGDQGVADIVKAVLEHLGKEQVVKVE